MHNRSRFSCILKCVELTYRNNWERDRERKKTSRFNHFQRQISGPWQWSFWQHWIISSLQSGRGRPNIFAHMLFMIKFQRRWAEARGGIYRHRQVSIKCECRLIDADRQFNCAIIHHILCRLNTSCVNLWADGCLKAHYRPCFGNHRSRRVLSTRSTGSETSDLTTNEKKENGISTSARSAKTHWCLLDVVVIQDTQAIYLPSQPLPPVLFLNDVLSCQLKAGIYAIPDQSKCCTVGGLWLSCETSWERLMWRWRNWAWRKITKHKPQKTPQWILAVELICFGDKKREYIHKSNFETGWPSWVFMLCLCLCLCTSRFFFSVLSHLESEIWYVEFKRKTSDTQQTGSWAHPP